MHSLNLLLKLFELFLSASKFLLDLFKFFLIGVFSLFLFELFGLFIFALDCSAVGLFPNLFFLLLLKFVFLLLLSLVFCSFSLNIFKINKQTSLTSLTL